MNYVSENVARPFQATAGSPVSETPPETQECLNSEPEHKIERYDPSSDLPEQDFRGVALYELEVQRSGDLPRLTESDFWHPLIRKRMSGIPALMKVHGVTQEAFYEIDKKRQVAAWTHPHEERDNFWYKAEDQEIVANIPSLLDTWLIDHIETLIQDKALAVSTKTLQLAVAPKIMWCRELEAESSASQPEPFVRSAAKGDAMFLPGSRLIQLLTPGAPAPWPSIVVEACIMLDTWSARIKAQWWFRASKGQVKAVLLCFLENMNREPWQLTFEVIRPDDTLNGKVEQRVAVVLKPDVRKDDCKQFEPDMFQVLLWTDGEYPCATGLDAKVTLWGKDLFAMDIECSDITIDAEDLMQIGAKMWSDETFWTFSERLSHPFWYQEDEDDE